MTHSVEVRRICLIAAANGDPAAAGPSIRCRNVLDRALRSVGVDGVGTWRQDRGSRYLVLLPVGTPARSTVPLLIHVLLEQFSQDRPGAGAVTLSLALGTVTQTRGGYAGQAIVTASRLLDSTDLHTALSDVPDALFAMIVSNDLYAEAIAQGGGTGPAEGFRRVTVDAPDNLWQGVGWLRAWGPASPRAQPGKKGAGKKSGGGLLPGLAGALNDVATIAQSSGSASGSAAHSATAETADLTAAHAAAAEHSYGAEQTYASHYLIQEGPGYLEETVMGSGSEGSAGYESGAGYDSADYHSSSEDHSGGGV